jgi:SagB-type dehydrogenase family enzyme
MYIKNLERPYLVAGGFPSGNSWTFFTSHGDVEIDGCNELLQKLLPLCSGLRKLSEVIEILGTQFHLPEIEQLIEILVEYLIIVDANRVFYSFHAYTRNPEPFSTGITKESANALIKDFSHIPPIRGRIFSVELKKGNLKKLLEKRKTVRVFSGEILEESDIAGLMWSMCGKQEYREDIEEYFQDITYNIPSGGALYPLLQYVFIFKKCGMFSPGLYFWRREISSMELVKEGNFSKELSFIVTGIDDMSGSVGIACVVADFEHSAKKYGNKSYNLIYLEAGHMMQNAHLFCTERKIGFVEVAGFYDEELARMLEIDFIQKAPLIAAVFGKELENESTQSVG